MWRSSTVTPGPQAAPANRSALRPRPQMLTSIGGLADGGRQFDGRIGAVVDGDVGGEPAVVTGGRQAGGVGGDQEGHARPPGGGHRGRLHPVAPTAGRSQHDGAVGPGDEGAHRGGALERLHLGPVARGGGSRRCARVRPPSCPRRRAGRPPAVDAPPWWNTKSPGPARCGTRAPGPPAPVDLLAVAAAEDGVEQADRGADRRGDQQAEAHRRWGGRRRSPPNSPSSWSETQSTMSCSGQGGAVGARQGEDRHVVRPGRHRAGAGIGLGDGHHDGGQVEREHHVGVGDDDVVVAARPARGAGPGSCSGGCRGCGASGSSRCRATAHSPGQLVAPARVGAAVVEHQHVDAVGAGPQAGGRLEAGGHEILPAVDQDRQQHPGRSHRPTLPGTHRTGLP